MIYIILGCRIAEKGALDPVPQARPHPGRQNSSCPGCTVSSGSSNKACGRLQRLASHCDISLYGLIFGGLASIRPWLLSLISYATQSSPSKFVLQFKWNMRALVVTPSISLAAYDQPPSSWSHVVPCRDSEEAPM